MMGLKPQGKARQVMPKRAEIICAGKDQCERSSGLGSWKYFGPHCAGKDLAAPRWLLASNLWLVSHDPSTAYSSLPTPGLPGLPEADMERVQTQRWLSCSQVPPSLQGTRRELHILDIE